ncbi:MAG: OstA family protein [Proteobacteria bacterium]|nr:OstA family protein [Pseudomonadota bacterium]
MKTVAFAFAAFVALIAFAPAAHAQISENGGPISYSADNLQYFDGDRRLVLTGNVDIVQNDARLRANQITLYFSRSTAPASASGQGQNGGLGSGDIQRMIAEGDVYYVRPQQSARGDRADYETSTDSVTFSGNVVVASEENVIRGETLVLQIGSRQTTIRPQNGQRVRGVFVPRHGAPQGNSGAN